MGNRSRPGPGTTRKGTTPGRAGENRGRRMGCVRRPGGTTANKAGAFEYHAAGIGTLSRLAVGTLAARRIGQTAATFAQPKSIPRARSSSIHGRAGRRAGCGDLAQPKVVRVVDEPDRRMCQPLVRNMTHRREGLFCFARRPRLGP